MTSAVKNGRVQQEYSGEYGRAERVGQWSWTSERQPEGGCRPDGNYRLWRAVIWCRDFRRRSGDKRNIGGEKRRRACGASYVGCRSQAEQATQVMDSGLKKAAVDSGSKFGEIFGGIAGGLGAAFSIAGSIVGIFKKRREEEKKKIPEGTSSGVERTAYGRSTARTSYFFAPCDRAADNA